MKQSSLKRRIQNKINLRSPDGLDFFEEIPPTKAYKLRRTIHRNLRKLKPVRTVGAK